MGTTTFNLCRLPTTTHDQIFLPEIPIKREYRGDFELCSQVKEVMIHNMFNWVLHLSWL